MFIIARRSARMPKALMKVFATYEAARSAIRSYLRKVAKVSKDARADNKINVGSFGFTVVRKY